MEEIILSAPGEEAPEAAEPQSPSVHGRDVSVPELRDRLHRDISQSHRARDRFVFTARGRKRRRDEFQAGMKRLAKSTASEIADPIDDRACRMATRTRIYTAMMVLIDASDRDHEAMAHRSRTGARRSVILTIATVLALGVLASSQGWI